MQCTMHNSFVVQAFLFGFAHEASSSKLVQCIEVVDLLVSCALWVVTIIR
jgi:hypothetical protein